MNMLTSVFMLFIFFLFSMMAYIITTSPVKFDPPRLSKESIDVSAFSGFMSLYPREEERVKREPLSIVLLSIATGSIKLALVQVDGVPQTVRIGSQVGNMRVVDIERNYIVLSKGDKRIAIGFSYGQESPPPSSSAPTETTSKSLQATIPRGELERITADPGIMFRQIRLVPFVREGRTRGFLFEWVEPGSIFDRAGIMQGDVLLSINNQEIKSGEDAFRILQVLRNESSIKLNLQRGNQLLELSLRVE